MKNYKTLDGSPTGTDSTRECWYTVSQGKPVIMLIENVEHLDYYACQWMVSFSINVILTSDPEVVKLAQDHPKFVHTTILFAEHPKYFEDKIIEYLDNYYRSIYSRSGIINYHVDNIARTMFARKNLQSEVFIHTKSDNFFDKELAKLQNKKFLSDQDSLLVCEVERNVSKYLTNKLDEKTINTCIKSVLDIWQEDESHILNCLERSIQAPFLPVKWRKQWIKKVRPELFFELYDLVNHHLVSSQRFFTSPDFPYQIGAILELYNWMNTYSLDDVFDNSTHRQKLETVWKKFSRKDAIYTGIIWHLLTLKHLLQITAEKPKIWENLAKIMNDYNLLMYQWQVIDIELTFDSEAKKQKLKKYNIEKVSDLYVQRIYGICGWFFEAIGLMSAKAWNKEEQVYNAKEVDKISPKIGMFYGIIQMIRNDLGDYIITEEITAMSKGMKWISHSDIQEGKIDIAYIVALYSDVLTDKEKNFLHGCLYKKLKTWEKKEINWLLWKSGAIDLTVELVNMLIKYVQDNLLTEYHETPTRTKWMFELVDITKHILIPFKDQAYQNKWSKYEYDKGLLQEIYDKIINRKNKLARKIHP